MTKKIDESASDSADISSEDAAKELGVPQSRIRKLAIKLGLSREGRDWWFTRPEVELLRQYTLAGMAGMISAKDLAEKYGINQRKITPIARELEIPRRGLDWRFTPEETKRLEARLSILPGARKSEKMPAKKTGRK